MTAPSWIATAVRDFGRAAGIDDLALNARGAAAFRFENGVSLRFESLDGELAMAATVPAAADSATAKRILACAHPLARPRVRSGYLAKTGCAVFAVRIPGQEVTLPALNSAFDALWRTATEFGGAS